MVTIRAYNPNDFEEIVDMYYKMIHEVYPHRQFKSKQYFYRNVMRWLDLNYDIMITEKDGVITGFCMCYYDSMGGICDDFYQAECVYVKPEYRKTKSAYLMYHSVMIYADKMGLLISTNAAETTESHKISDKFGLKLFSHYERLPKKGE